MGLKDILAIVLDAEEDAAAVRAAERLATRYDAHLAAAFLTALPDEPLAYEPSVVAGVWAELLTRARTEATAERAKVERALAALVRPCELRSAEALARDLGRVAAVHARYADLAIVRRPEDTSRDPRHDIIEGVLFHSGRPALIVPPAWSAPTIGRRPIVAWDASREATRALAEARPLMEGAEQVTILTIDAKPRAFGHGDLPGANIAAHLNRRGLSATVVNVDGLGQSAAEVIVQQAQDLGSDLIVMGGYGTARIRELLFGGATRDLLEIASVPLLMAH